MIKQLVATTALFLTCVHFQLAHAGTSVEVKTTAGNFVVELNNEKAPKTTDNFLKYVNSGFYKDTIFHRVINGFMIQGGGFTKDMQQKPTGAPIPIESNNGLKNVAYTIAMARTADPNSATAQFFINVVDNPNLDYPRPDGYGYAVFGTVIQGKETIDAIKRVATGRQSYYSDVPVSPIVIKEINIIKP